MSSLFFPSHSITIRKLHNKGGLRQAFSATGTVWPADVQPVEADRVNDLGGRIGKLHEAWVGADTPIKEGDQVDANGKRYSVRAVSTYENAGLLDHLHLILESQDG